MENKKLYQILASTVDAYHRCETNGNKEWSGKHADRIEYLCKTYLPWGSGFDSGTTLDLANSRGDKLVFNTSFHHMNQNGMYDRWTEHTIKIRPCMINGFTVSRITGVNRNDIKGLIGEIFSCDLSVV
jgi:hypothetical protein